jgi:hypothetical protein
MGELEIKIQPNRLVYIPKALVELLGKTPQVTADRCAVVLYSKDTKTEDVLKSLEIIMLDLKHKQRLERQLQLENKEAIVA